jgi:hypothetical protein
MVEKLKTTSMAEIFNCDPIYSEFIINLRLVNW